MPYNMFNTYSICSGSIQSPTYLACSFISKYFFYKLGTTILKNTSQRLLFIVFSLTARWIYHFVFSKNLTSCTSFLQSGTWNLFNYSGCFSTIFSSFSEHKCSFQEVFHKGSCSAKWCDKIIKHSSSVPVVKSRKVQLY